MYNIARSAAVRSLAAIRQYPPNARIATLPRPTPRAPIFQQQRFASVVADGHVSTSQLADEKIEEITELYATAKDEFEIAYEETEKMTVYAEEDRAAAREELTKVQQAYRAVVDGQDQELAGEVARRIGQRIRELEHGVKAMEELAQNQD